MGTAVDESLFAGLETRSIEEVLQGDDDASGQRQEEKFIVSADLLPEVLTFLSDGFLVCNHQSGCVVPYHNTYYDSDDFALYRLHRQGKFNRLKVRVREYRAGPPARYLELKHKVRGTRTFKERRLLEAAEAPPLGADFVAQALAKHSVAGEDLRVKATLSYRRVTLVSKDATRRLTIDSAIRAGTEGREVELLPTHAVLETKGGRHDHEFARFLRRNYGVRRTGFSKYCIGASMLYPELPNNRWKPLLRRYC